VNEENPFVLSAKLSEEDRHFLLKLARQAIEFRLKHVPLPKLEIGQLSKALQEHGATFVTLTIFGELRGCVGTLEAYQPLAEDVREHALAAAFRDYRFPPLRENELSHLHIEISRLVPPKELEYITPEELPTLLRQSIDGVTLMDGDRRATFLPQVWQKIDSPEIFLDHLCAKMGASPDLWRQKKLRVQIYQVEEFQE
jgi:AmmeMemoRadiSam system protein A